MEITSVARFLAASPGALCDWPYYRAVRFVDGGDICTLELDGSLRREPVAASTFAPRLGGGAIIVRGAEVALAARDSLRDLSPFTALDLAPGVWVTAGACDPDGALFVADSAGRLHQIEPTSKRVRVALTDVGSIAAITWSTDGEWAYLAGTAGIIRYAYDPISGFDVGETGARLVAEALAPDLEGGLYAVSGGQLWHLDSVGEPTVLAAPESRVTSVAATEAGLVFTTVDPDGRGELWRLPDAHGLPARPFGG